MYRNSQMALFLNDMSTDVDVTHVQQVIIAFADTVLNGYACIDE